MEKINYIEKIMVPGRIIILDSPLSPSLQREISNLETSSNQPVIFLEDKKLSDNLELLLQAVIKKYRDILFVFPGNGSNYPKKLTRSWRQFPFTSVSAKRIWSPGNNPVALVGQVIPSRPVILEFKTIIVVDDVISSGITMRQIYKKNSWRFPIAEWLAFSWISQSLESGIKGYKEINVSSLVEGINKAKVPINSLSTLRSNSEILNSYARRHFISPGKFIEMIMPE